MTEAENEISDCHILLVDDEKDLLYMVRDLLKEEGYRTVDSAASCKEAEEMVAKNQVELVILDVMLFGWKWFFFQEQIRDKAYRGIPVIFLSARDAENEAKLKGLGPAQMIILPNLATGVIAACEGCFDTNLPSGRNTAEPATAEGNNLI